MARKRNKPVAPFPEPRPPLKPKRNRVKIPRIFRGDPETLPEIEERSWRNPDVAAKRRGREACEAEGAHDWGREVWSWRIWGGDVDRVVWVRCRRCGEFAQQRGPLADG